MSHRHISQLNQDTQRGEQPVFMMVNERGGNNSGLVSNKPHKCGLTCLGPLTFHCNAVGAEVSLSEGGRLAQRTACTFKNGLVFTSRPVKVHERIRLRVEKDVFVWHGAMRVGFTTVAPATRQLPLPCMAVPNLTDRPGHWAGIVPESYCQEGSELEFWVSFGGTVYIGSGNRQQKLLEGVDLSGQLWAMVDIYGQTCCVSLLGSEIKGWLYSRKSCPAPTRTRSSSYGGVPTAFSPGPSGIYSNNKPMSFPDTEGDDDNVPTDEKCVVCLGNKATVALPCAHRCMCGGCALRVIRQFKCCPLCRYKLTAPSLQRSSVSQRSRQASAPALTVTF